MVFIIIMEKCSSEIDLLTADFSDAISQKLSFSIKNKLDTEQ